MGLPFHQLKKLWLIYLFLLFFAFFMFALSINLYLTSLHSFFDKDRQQQQRLFTRRRFGTTTKNVIAHYIGHGDLTSNISAEEQNFNDFNPVESEGADGRPVLIPPRDRYRMQRLFKLNSFNVMASDRIPLNRTLRDYRIRECRDKKYPKKLPTASVIIVFHNEAWSVLLRTLTSVINRTPRKLIREIILVDDASTRSYLKKQLENYIKVLEVPTRLYRLPDRQGLVPARLLGAEKARGDVLTFLDAHCECSKGWLEPLLARVHESPTSVVSPVIDIISDDNFSYTKVFEYHWAAFNWQLSFRWFNSERKKQKRGDDPTETVKTPAMAGGLFVIDKKYFYEIGSYDNKMKIWGGENIEMSLRVWQCGGSIEIHPCAHVGHVFRSHSPYTFPGGMETGLAMNLMRASKVWMDEWDVFVAHYTNGVTPELAESIDVKERLELRERLNCKPFSWYLENVWPEHFFPANDRFFGKIIWLSGETECSQSYSTHMKNIPGRLLSREWPKILREIRSTADKLSLQIDFDQDKCLRPIADDVPRASLQPVTVGYCDSQINNLDNYIVTPEGQIVTNNYNCLTYSEPRKGIVDQLRNSTTSNVHLTLCSNDARQLWKYDMDTQQISHSETKLCLTLKSAKTVRSEKVENIIVAMECNYKDITQKWGFIQLPWTTQ